jgi:hypothetical protein
MIKMLPHWVLENPTAAFYDTESGSSIEQTARVYAKMQELIEDYNKFVDDINKHIADHEAGLYESNEAFKTCIINTIENYIKSIDMRIDFQDMKIANQDAIISEQNTRVDDAVIYFKVRVDETIEDLINEMKTSGEFDQSILDAIDNITNSYNTLNERVSTLENTSYSIVYDSYKEEIILEKMVGGA